jgi:transcriptional regulator with XRE-family HTH domain
MLEDSKESIARFQSQVAELEERNRQLEAESKKIKSDMETTTSLDDATAAASSSRCPTRSSNKLKQRHVSTQVDLKATITESFSTGELAEKVRQLLKRLGLTITSLAKRLDMSRTNLGHLIKYPEPYGTMSEPKREHYRKLSAWYAQNECRPDHDLSTKKWKKRKRLADEADCGSNDDLSSLLSDAECLDVHLYRKRLIEARERNMSLQAELKESLRKARRCQCEASRSGGQVDNFDFILIFLDNWKRTQLNLKFTQNKTPKRTHFFLKIQNFIDTQRNLKKHAI